MIGFHCKNSAHNTWSTCMCCFLPILWENYKIKFQKMSTIILGILEAEKPRVRSVKQGRVEKWKMTVDAGISKEDMHSGAGTYKLNTK